MLPRPVMIATLLGASVGVPYAVSQHQAHQATKSPPGAANASAGENATTTSSDAPAVMTKVAALDDPFALQAAPMAMPGTVVAAPVAHTSPPAVPLHPVETVLRFDLTRDWVYQNWERKTTSPTPFGLMAVRVTLVSGTELSSIAGSLTYFFNSNGAIEHISFRGRTGNATRLVVFLKRTYLFEEVPSAIGEQVYRVLRNGKLHSELHIRPEPVQRISTPHSNLLVELELARPGTNRFLPPRDAGLQMPPTASTSAATPGAQPAPQGAAAAGGEEKAPVTRAFESYVDKVRYATPQEEGQVLWKRWPN